MGPKNPKSGPHLDFHFALTNLPKSSKYLSEGSSSKWGATVAVAQESELQNNTASAGPPDWAFCRKPYRPPPQESRMVRFSNSYLGSYLLPPWRYSPITAVKWARAEESMHVCVAAAALLSHLRRSPSACNSATCWEAERNAGPAHDNSEIAIIRKRPWALKLFSGGLLDRLIPQGSAARLLRRQFIPATIHPRSLECREAMITHSPQV